MSKCSITARLTFIGMWTECDDFGRGVADARVLKGSIWPLDDDVTPDAITAHLDQLTQTGHIRLYTSGDETYYEVIAFEKHQSAAYRRGVSKFPDPSALSCTILHDEECKIVLEGKGREGIGKEAATTPVVTNDPYDLAVAAAVETRRKQTTKPITNPDAWTRSVKAGIETDKGPYIRQLLAQGHNPDDTARIALGELPASTPTERTFYDAEQWACTIAQGEQSRGDPYDPDEFAHICKAANRDPEWTTHALDAYLIAYNCQRDYRAHTVPATLSVVAG